MPAKQAAVATAGADQVEISAEARSALVTDQAMARSEKMMRVRGLNDEEIASFREILSGYESSGTDAADFLKSLSSEERDLVKRANSYGSDLDNGVIDGFSEEGAINMLREQDYRFAVDLNGDDIVEHGAAKTFSFPPPSAPEGVMDAWDAYSRKLSDQDKMMFTIMFTPVDIPGQGDATTIRGYNLSKQGFPANEEGWLELIDKIHNTLAYDNKLSGDKEQIEQNEKLMGQLTDFASYIR
jgi:hypothetical protein